MVSRSNIRKSVHSAKPVRWEVADRLVPYPEAVARMEAEAAAIAAGEATELVWLLQHPPLHSRHIGQAERPAAAGPFSCVQSLAVEGNTPIMGRGSALPM